MTNVKKQKNLEKYLAKKVKQKKRDVLFAEINQINDLRKTVKNETAVKNEETLKTVAAKKKKKKKNFNEIISNEMKNNVIEKVNKSPYGIFSTVDDVKNIYADEIQKFARNELSENISNKNYIVSSPASTNKIFDIADLDNTNEKINNDIPNCRFKQENSLKLKSVETLTSNDRNLDIIVKLAEDENGKEKITENQRTQKIIASAKEFPKVVRTNEIQERRQNLPIFYEEENIVSIIKSHTVTLITGETGSGKSTQIPQFLYENGFKNIGITQPRRISTLALSKRINKELNANVSGYKIKYENNITKNTVIKVMTDGILLKELQSDFLLKSYDVIILDEVHERNVNIEILISLLIKILSVRKQQNNELKLILMSATMDTDYIENLFTQKIGRYNVEAQSFKVSIFYENVKVDYIEQVYEKVKSILNMQEYKNESDFNSKILSKKRKYIENEFKLPVNVKNDDSSTILIFVPTKDDIYNLIYKLNDLDVIALPLHSLLSYKEQACIYKAYDKRKVIVSTNIAETSITIPDVVFVIDTGRVKTKKMKNGNICFKINFVSKSSAFQRSGRAGRTSDGVCFRLFSGHTYEKFEDNTEPEIFNCPLEDVILDLKALGIQNIYKFPFITKPETAKLDFGIDFLKKLGALDSNNKITGIGEEMSKYPLNARLSRFLCFENNLKNEILLMVAILSNDFEIKKQENYTYNLKSDIFVKMNMIIEYCKSENKKLAAKKLSLHENKAIEILKAYEYLKKLKNYDAMLVNAISEEKYNALRKIIFSGFCDNLVVKTGNEYLYKNEPIYFSKESLKIEGDFFVFDYIIEGKTKKYMKNITKVEKEWVEKLK